MASTAINIACVVLCHQIAKRRGAKPVFWGVMGALFGPFAIPFALLAKPKTK
ncbi:MAG: hypothetical protein OEN02_11830 [Gammaproteobacteria bacterium]|nr:hypothetical protein [Gammaproteobacteria bacterium]